MIIGIEGLEIKLSPHKQRVNSPGDDLWLVETGERKVLSNEAGLIRAFEMLRSTSALHPSTSSIIAPAFNLAALAP
jgi:hypothetical protein